MVHKLAAFSFLTVMVMAAVAPVGFSSPANGLVATRAAVRTVASATTSSIVGSRLPVGTNVEANGLGVADLTSVSCPTSGFCAAVDAAGFAYIYERSAWSRARKIAGGTSILDSVSCPTASFCMAVAGSTNGAGGSTYLYSHGRWSSGQRFTKDGYGESSVSCPAVSRCVVVGWGGDHHYSNGMWSTQVSFAGPVTSLTCTSVAFCVAVQQVRGDGGIAITYAHGKWSTKNGGVIAEPSAVSCASTSFCIALGRNSAYSYSNGTWSSAQPLGLGITLSSVSCPSRSFCVAVGGSGTTGGALPGYGITYSNGFWSTGQKLGSELSSVSCPTSKRCIAVGLLGHAFTYSDGHWS
jgi:hypothetical protein